MGGGAGNSLEEELGRGLEGRLSLPGEALRGRGDGFEVGFWGEEARVIFCFCKDPPWRASPISCPVVHSPPPPAGSYFASSCSDSWRA